MHRSYEAHTPYPTFQKIKTCSYSTENINTCSRLLTFLIHVYWHIKSWICQILAFPRVDMGKWPSQAKGNPFRGNKPQSEGTPGKIPLLDKYRIWRRLSHDPPNFYFALGMCICKNPIQELWQSPGDQEGTRLRIKSIFGKVRKRQGLKDPRPLMTSRRNLISLNALPPSKLYVILYNKSPYCLGYFKFDTYLQLKSSQLTQWVINQVYGNYFIGNYSG